MSTNSVFSRSWAFLEHGINGVMVKLEDGVDMKQVRSSQSNLFFVVDIWPTLTFCPCPVYGALHVSFHSPSEFVINANLL
jgi:hypothetical protein